eukprot:Pgem_evm1s3356
MKFSGALVLACLGSQAYATTKKCKSNSCAAWFGENNCPDTQLPKPDSDNKKCKTDEKCIKRCCQPKETCADWEVTCSKGKKMVPDFATTICKNNDCEELCCEKKTCEDWEGCCEDSGQNDIPDFATTPCHGNACEEKCCTPKYTCGSWLGGEIVEEKCKANGLLPPVDDTNNKECEDDECVEECCGEAGNCVDWGVTCPKHKKSVPDFATTICENDNCEELCCEQKTCDDWEGNCVDSDQIKIPDFVTTPCNGGDCSTKCCMTKPKTCKDYEIKISVDGAAPVKPQHVKLNTSSGPQKLIVTSNHDVEMALKTNSERVFLDKCSLDVDQDGDSVWVSTDTGNVKGNVEFQFVDETNATCKIHVGVEGKCRQKQCLAWGDPHFTNLDGNKFNYHSHSYSTFFSSKDLLIKGSHWHQDHDSHKKKASTYSGLMIQYKDTVLNFTSDDIKMKAQSLSLTTLNGEELENICYREKVHKSRGKVNKLEYWLEFPEGSKAMIEAKPSSKWRWHLKILFTPNDRYFEQVEGVCGNWDGNKHNDKHFKATWRATNLKEDFSLPVTDYPSGVDQLVCPGSPGSNNAENRCGRIADGDYKMVSVYTGEKEGLDYESSRNGDLFSDGDLECGIITNSEWAQTAIRAGCIDDAGVEQLVKDCMYEQRHGNGEAITETVDTLVLMCIADAENKGEMETDEFFLFAKANNFGSCSYPIGGEPTEEGCNCNEGFAGADCE